MDLLLDTHTFLWFIAGDSRLSTPARSFIEDSGNTKFVSIASLWEIAIKVSINKITLKQSFDQLFPAQLHMNGFFLLPVSIAHTSRVSTLPFHHRDPFDRLIIAQALEENMSVVGTDQAFNTYGVNRIW